MGLAKGPKFDVEGLMNLGRPFKKLAYIPERYKIVSEEL